MLYVLCVRDRAALGPAESRSSVERQEENENNLNVSRAHDPARKDNQNHTPCIYRAGPS